ncbi:MAG: AEC family transporter [Clostridia bacterium]|nr:AEC family transporter [Clostridia bacterium]
MIFAINAVLPVVLFMAFGYVLKIAKLIDRPFTTVANRLCFRVLIPILLFCNIYSLDSIDVIDWTLVLFCVCATLAIFIAGFVFVKLCVKDDKQKGVILQCVFRSNFAIIGLPVAAALCENGGASSAALLSAFTIPLFNVLAVISLSVFIKGDRGEHTIKKTFTNILTNPLIIGVVAGLAALLLRSIFVNNGVKFRLTDATALYTFIVTIGKIASPLSLIVLGAGFSFRAVSGLKKMIIIGTASRILVVPAVVLTAALLIMPDMSSQSYAGMIALFASPVAVTSAIMAKEMGSDEQLAAQLVVWTTIFSIATLFLIAMVFKMIGVF